MASILLEARPYRPFKSSEEYLEAMREDLAEWLNIMYPELLINADNFMDRLDTGVALCKHANNVRQAAEDYLARRQARNKSMTRSMTSGLAGPILAMGSVHYLPAAKSGTFFARDNVSNFITWCRKALKIFECLLFETDDLIMRKNEKHVILCLLEVARRGAKFGMLAPMLVQMERQIDREIAADNKANGVGTQTDACNGTNTIGTGTDMFDSDSEEEDDNDGPMLMYGPQPQIVTNDLKSLDEMVRDLVEKCTCPSQFPMVRVSEGKYRIGDTKVLIFVRILRSHVMVRVGGGWDTLSHYLDKHDPCRCRAQHRSSVAARLVPRTNMQTNGIELHKAQVIYERSPPSARRVVSAANTLANGGTTAGMGSPYSVSSNYSSPINSSTLSTLSPPSRARSRSRSPTPQRKFLNSLAAQQQQQFSTANANASTTSMADSFNVQDNSNRCTQQQATLSSPSIVRRSMSPSPRRIVEFRKKQTSLESATYTPTPTVQFDTTDSIIPTTKLDSSIHLNTTQNNGGTTTATETSTKFENISDNGSEISDEGYRSLGLIQPGMGGNGSTSLINGAQKRESLHSQTSIEDAETSARLDQNSSDSQISPSEEHASSTKTPENGGSNSSFDLVDSPEKLPAEYQSSVEPTNSFEQSGVFITDDEITVDIASSTGLRKTGFSDNLYGEDNGLTAKKPTTKIPRSPVVPRRRRSVDNTSDCGSDLSQRTGLPIFNRKQPTYRSVRQTTDTSKSPRSGMGREVTNTWNGRTSTPKKRAPITNDTFTSPNTTNFTRNSKTRSSQIAYDSNGRRIKTSSSSSSLNSSPIKSSSSSNICTSPLAQQLLEAAGNAKNDAQILEKMKQLLAKYSNLNGKPPKQADYDDFTTAWVHSNGKLDRASSCSPPTKGPSKRSSAASSIESNNSRDVASLIVSPRRDRGTSRIPAPVRHNTELY